MVTTRAEILIIFLRIFHREPTIHFTLGFSCGAEMKLLYLWLSLLLKKGSEMLKKGNNRFIWKMKFNNIKDYLVGFVSLQRNFG